MGCDIVGFDVGRDVVGRGCVVCCCVDLAIVGG